MKVITWNMNRTRSSGNWSLFKEGAELVCDIGLVSEGKPPPPHLGLEVETEGSTIGRDDKLHGGNKERDWATAIVSPYKMEWPYDVWALSPRSGDRRSELRVSRPGSWTAAVVSLPSGESVTAISLYGLLDERSDASVHRSLSDLTPLFEDSRYNEHLVLGGDLNTLCTAEVGSRRLARDQGVLDRITQGFWLVELLPETMGKMDPPRGRLPGCPCKLGGDCRHTWTYRKGTDSAVAYQDDYLFASRALADRLAECTAREFAPDWPSDHVPIIATFK